MGGPDVGGNVTLLSLRSYPHSISFSHLSFLLLLGIEVEERCRWEKEREMKGKVIVRKGKE